MKGLKSNASHQQKPYFFVLSLLLLFMVAIPLQAADKLFTAWILPQAPGVTDGTGGLDTASIANIQVNLDTAITGSLTAGQQLDVPLLDGQTLLGTVQQAIINAAGDTVEILSLQDGKGGLELTVNAAGVVTEMLLFNKEENKFFKALLDANGTGAFIEQDANDFVCVEYPLPAEAAPSAAEFEIQALTPEVGELQSLQSRPGASNVLYLDYWGGTVSGTIWNNNFNSGNDIVYTPYSYDSDTSTFSEQDRHQMWLGWREAAEDFAPFNVNVTTDPAVYDAADINKKVRNISTKTNDFYTGAGGVAYLNSFTSSSTYRKISWSWNRFASSHGMTISHEIGHQLGLSHDGFIGGPSYSSGHGEWGPIMGAPFGKEYVQWSKGEYDNANRTQDDLAIISGKTGTVADEAGDTVGTAAAIGAQVTDQEGLIEPEGITGGKDVDFYTFTLTADAATQIQVTPIVIDDDSDEQYGTNLSMKATLLDSAQNPVAGQNPVGGLTPTYNPITNILTYDGTLVAGTYYLKVEAESPDLNWSTGFGEYGDGGLYRILLDVQTSTNPPGSTTLVSPTGTIAALKPTFVWQAVPEASQYRLMVSGVGGGLFGWVSATEVGCSGGTGTCSIQAPNNLALGDHNYWVRTGNDAGDGPWTAAESFTIGGSIPGSTTLLSPTGTITETKPTYQWQAVVGATRYRLMVSGVGGGLYDWVDAASVGCGGGSGTCSTTAPIDLALGDHNYWVRTGSDAGDGPWTAAESFTIGGSIPGSTTLLSPTGTITETKPTYQWQAVVGATRYRLMVSGVGGGLYDWVDAASVGCGGGSGTCSTTAPIDLALGDHNYWVRTGSDAGDGPWTTAKSFSIGGGVPPATSGVSPTGTIAESTPEFSWQAVPEATRYRLMISGVGGAIYDWVPAIDVGCHAGSGICALTPERSLASGDHSFWVRTGNDNGDGPWTTRNDFVVSN